MNTQEEIEQITMGRPHVVILGAGASIAATHPFGGDKFGKKLPGMVDFVDVLEIGDILTSAGISYEGLNFEDVYNKMYHDGRHDMVRSKIEEIIHNYFSELSLPGLPTMYDRLVLSLRKKDVIATFNWDPFLMQAWRRNLNAGLEMPKIYFLHGNVETAYCNKHKKLFVGLSGAYCGICGEELEKTKLLHPIKDKDYINDPFIKLQWDHLATELEKAFMVTILGYGALSSDVGVVGLMHRAWGDRERRNMEQFEIINVLSEAELRKTWRNFIHTHHYEVHRTFEESWIGLHPRRSGEAYYNQYMMALYIEDNPIPNFESMEKLQEWYQRFKPAEEKENLESI